ncbi:MAG: hypothetical protein K0B15_13735 [Lentimicrobium sp.]|nr:hypothetical protein [Lentimicrobium sp.]
MRTLLHSIFIFSLTLFINKPATAQVFLDLETGTVFTGYNNVRIPGDQGTLFSLKDDVISKPKIFYRLRAGYTIQLRHTLSLLYAPFETRSEGRVANDVFFEGALFPANTLLNGTYKFNSYRLTYRYDFVNKPGFVFGIGFTAKIRDAAIGLTSPELTAKKTNVGFVPIINFRLGWKIDDRFGLLAEGDALAAPQGRAEDVHFAVTWKLSDNIDIRTGYRILEGGADNDEVYNFSLFHYASAGITYTFQNK